jgi:two-component system, NtrC family, sensor histidine kinase HydH
VVLLIRHLLTATDREEKSRTRLLLLALLFGASGTLADFLNDLGAPIPRLSTPGTFVASLLLGVVALRLRLFGRPPSRRAVIVALLVTAGGVLSYLAALHFLSEEGAALAIGVGMVMVTLVVAGRERAVARRAERERLRQLALLGRFSAQMAHDLKNPLAALSGAVDFLREEVSRGAALASHGTFLDLIAQQAERLRRVIEGCERLGRVEPQPLPVDLNVMVKQVLSLQRFAAIGVRIETFLDPHLPALMADPDLLARGTENLVRNALEAMPEGGVLTVRTSLSRGAHNRPCVAVSVRDTGCGMDPRQAERALDDFYTTKPEGTGLGLAFVRRVVTAHGGDVKLVTAPARGTEVTLRLPVPAQETHVPLDERPAQRRLTPIDRDLSTG